MKKGWKITLIVLGSLVGLALLLLLLAYIALRIALTPANLTKIVNGVAEDYVHCESHFERVELSLFKTFPNVGLEVKNVCLINPYTMPDSIPLAARAEQNDTLAHIGNLTIGIDAMAYLKEKQMIVHQLRLDDVLANLYTAPDGWSNLDVFETTDDEDTSSTAPDLALVDLNKININHLRARYCDLKQGMLAKTDDLSLTVQGRWQDSDVDADVDLEVKGMMADLCDSLGNQSLCARLSDVDLAVKAKGPLNALDGRVRLEVASGDILMGSTTYMTAEQRPKDLLKLNIPFHADLDNQSVTLKEAFLRLLDYTLHLDGSVALAHDGQPMNLDLAFRTDKWDVKSLLAALPASFTKSLKGMDIAADLSLDGHASGVVAGDTLPQVTAHVALDRGSFSAPKMLPMKLTRIKGDINVDWNENLNLEVATLSLKADHNTLSLKGNVDDLLGDTRIDANIKGNVSLPELRQFLPDTMPISLQGTSGLDIDINSRLDALKDVNLKKMKLNGLLHLRQFDVLYDSIHAASPRLDVQLSLQPNAQPDKLIGIALKGGNLDVNMPASGIDAAFTDPDIQIHLPNLLDKRQPLAVAFDVAAQKLVGNYDSIRINSAATTIKGSVRNDTTQTHALKRWNPRIEASLKDASVALAGLDETLRLPTFNLLYLPEVCEVRNVDLRIGRSDYHLYGRLNHLEDWLSKPADARTAGDFLRGDLYFSSQYTDLDQLLDLLSGLGSDDDTLAVQRKEDNVPAAANPFIVPKDVNVTLHTAIDHCYAYGNDLQDLKGTVTVNNGTAILDQIGFTCKAANMQLTGIYRSPRPNHLFVGLDFHLLDITVEELIAMVPAVDTLVPMLSAFKGKANFHLAAECNLNAFYQPKMSTLLGAAAISGQDLVVMDDKSISDIAKLLQMKDWREKDNSLRIDSLSVEATAFRKEIIVYPFLLNVHNYNLVVGGRHTLDNACNYHVELIKCPLPMRLAVDVKGTLNSPKITLGEVKYAELFQPEKQNAVQARTLELKNMIRQALEANVR